MDSILILWERCNGCGDCLAACTAEMARLGEPLPHIPRLTVRGQERPAYVALCRHCIEAPCRDACISGAITVADGGRVELADEVCVRCCMCLAHCPFGAMVLVGDHVVKCDICTPPGVSPLCVRSCPEGALVMGMAQRLSLIRGRQRAHRKMDAIRPQAEQGNQNPATTSAAPGRSTATQGDMQVDLPTAVSQQRGRALRAMESVLPVLSEAEGSEAEESGDEG